MRERIARAIRRAVPRGLAFEVTLPGDPLFGHYSTNVAFQVAKATNISPMAAADAIRRRIDGVANRRLFERIEVARPGFINFWISASVFHQELRAILKRRDAYGKPKLRTAKRKRVQVEFVSANPTGPLTLANGRGGFLGDVLANVLTWGGCSVEREYYVNDTGKQIVTLGQSILAAAGLLPRAEGFYQGSYVADWARANAPLVKKLGGDPLLLGQRAARDFLKAIRRVVEREAHIRFDRYTSEAVDLHRKGYVKRALELLEAKKVVYRRDGAIWFATTSFGDDKDRVLVTGDGYPTYFLADAGHYLQTKDRGFQTKINVLGPDHYGYVRRIQAAATVIGIKESHVIITQAVRVADRGKELKMSKRRGTFITFSELVRDVGHDAARFLFLMVSPDTHVDFDLALAKERSVKNPVFYVQYAYVRALSIFRRTGQRLRPLTAKVRCLTTEHDLALLRELTRFPEVLLDTARDFQVNRLTRYGLELARTFHNFYERERVVGERKDLAAARLALVAGTEVVLRNLFQVLGISAPKKM